VLLGREDLQKELELVAINTSGSMPAANWAHLLKYDTAYGPLRHEMNLEEVASPENAPEADPVIGKLKIGTKQIPLLAQREPGKLPWSKYAVDVVIEATGVFTSEEKSKQHLEAGAKKVLISTPSKGGNVETIVIGANTYQGKSQITDNASCTTNCIAPVVAILQAKFGILKATMTTVHGYTDDQRLQDGSHKDLRRARAAAQNIIPTSTGAAQATTKTLPELEGLFDGVALRVPVITGSISDITCLLKQKTTVEAVNQAFVDASSNLKWQRIVATTEEPLVSSDIIGHFSLCIPPIAVGEEHACPA
jgi:glyceraldehyde 3-phosphate dehydrogenase